MDNETERIAKLIVDSAFKVHSKLGPGLLEKVYEICFCYELSKRGLFYKRQVDIPIIYEEMKFKEGHRFKNIGESLCLRVFVAEESEFLII